MKYLISAASFALLTACTYNVSMAHTEGTASDVVDTEQKSDADVSPTVNIPVKPL